MKYRCDFVTNSSSSSYIIATAEEIPEEYAARVKRLTPENLLEAIKETSGYSWSFASEDLTDDQLKELGGFTDEQLDIMKLDQCGDLIRYWRVLQAIKKADKPVYHIFEDRDWLYTQPALNNLISGSDIIDVERDL